MLLLSQLKTLLWLRRCTARSDYPTIISVLLVPSILLLLSSTSSSTGSVSKKNTLVECTAASFLYCNYPMSINFDDASFYPLETNPIVATLQEAASNVAQSYGSDYDTVFQNDVEFPERVGASIMIKSSNETSTVTWYDNMIHV